MSVIDSNDILLVESTSIFIQSPGVVDEEFTPTLHILDGGIDNWHSQSYVLEALSSTIDGNVPSFSTIIRRSTPIKCVYEGPEAENSLYSVNHNMTMQSNFSDFEWDGNTLTFKINLIYFDDGWYDIILFAQSENEDDTYSDDCISIRIDNTPPVVIVDIPEELPEGTDTVYLDASSTVDDFWGIQGLTYTWSINENRRFRGRNESGPQWSRLSIDRTESR